MLLKMCLVLNGPYLLDYASPGRKPYICELAPNLLLMPINFVLGQIDIQTVIRHDLVLLTDLFPGVGTATTKFSSSCIFFFKKKLATYSIRIGIVLNLVIHCYSQRWYMQSEWCRRWAAVKLFSQDGHASGRCRRLLPLNESMTGPLTLDSRT